MPKNSLIIKASDDFHWIGCPPACVSADGKSVRSLPTSNRFEVEIDGNRKQKSFIALEFAGNLDKNILKKVVLAIDGHATDHFFNPDFPQFVLLTQDFASGGSTYGAIRLEINLKDSLHKQNFAILNIYYLPARGMFSRLWASKKRIALSKKTGGKPEWSPEDFPYSHFDGLAYLSENQVVRDSIVEGGCASALEFFYKHGKLSGPPVTLAVDSKPTPGGIQNIVESACLVRSLRKKLSEKDIQIEESSRKIVTTEKNAFKLQQECDLILKTLHDTQEELERKFIEKSDSDSKIRKLSTQKIRLLNEKKSIHENFESAKKETDRLKFQLQEVVKERSKLDAEFAGQLEKLTAEKASLDARVTTLVTERDARTKERDEQVKISALRQVALEALQKELEFAKADNESINNQHAHLSAQLQRLSEELDQVRKGRDAEAKIATERETALETLGKELEVSKSSGAEVEKKRAEVAGQLEKLGAEKAALETRLSALVSERDALTKERNEHSKTTAERQTALEALKKELEASKASGAEVEMKRAEVAGQLEKLGADKAVLETRLAALVSERDARTNERDEHSKTLAERQTALEALKKELEASKASGAEVEMKRAEVAGQLEKLGADKAALETRLSALVSERDARTKERDQARTECEALSKERDQLKKTAGDRAARIAELEAQIADQTERQKQIDEQMVRAETQIEMLKEFLQPSFQ